MSCPATGGAAQSHEGETNMATYEVTVGISNGTMTVTEAVEAPNGEAAKKIAEARTGGKAQGYHEV
jgi:nitrous oxide reductase accessory protein NosL